MGINCMLPELSVVIGATASGKSGFAERLVTSTMRQRIYIATAQAFDDEMRHKIARHKETRGAGWRTVEAPLEIAQPLINVDPACVVLLDCATLWLSNQMLADNDIEQATTELLSALQTCPAPVVVVSNEVGAGGVSDNAMARQFTQAQGLLNQRLAAQAGLVVSVTAGLPLVLKGTLPETVE